jgi:hypothetical protein
MPPYDVVGQLFDAAGDNHASRVENRKSLCDVAHEIEALLD